MIRYLRWMLRESRGARGRMAYFTACLALGVAAVVGTAALSAGIEKGYRAQSRKLLGGDLSVDSRRPLPPELEIPGAERADALESATMVSPSGGGDSTIALLFAVQGRYPLYGGIETQPPGGLEEHLTRDSVVAEEDLLRALRLEPGDALRVGSRDLVIAAAAVGGPGDFGFSAFLGPRIYLSHEAFDTTGLLSFGSRARHRALFAIPGEPSRAELDARIEELKARVPGALYLDFDTHYEIGPGRGRRSDRIEGFIGLVALLSLVVGGIGVSQIVRAWLAERTAAIAVMRCLGMRPPQILALSLGHAGLLALAGSVAGAALGCVLPVALRPFAEGVLQAEIAAVVPLAAIARGVALGVGLALAFALPPLASIWRVSPARVLRNDAEPLPPNRAASWASAGVLAASLFGAAWAQAGAPLPAAWFATGFAVLAGALWLGSRVLIGVAGRMPRARLSPYLVHGISALARPNAGTTGAVVALGLGTMVVTTVWLVETRLREGLLAQIPESAPSMFFVDIQGDQRADVRRVLEGARAEAIDEVPVVMARIAAVDGRPVEELAGEDGRARRALTRELRLTWREDLTPDNRVTAGAWWSDPAAFEVSIEEGFAERLGVGVGAEIEFDVQGVPVTMKVTSLRSVEWRSFGINFFLIAEPGALEGAPALWLASARVPVAAEQDVQNALAGTHPNVTVLRVGPILDQAVALVQRVAGGIRILGAFAALAGLAVLAGAVSTATLRRGREIALWKTLGVTRAGVAALFAAEHGLTGAVAGAVGAGGALLLAWAYLEHVADLDVPLPLTALPIATACCALLTAVCCTPYLRGRRNPARPKE